MYEGVSMLCNVQVCNQVCYQVCYAGYVSDGAMGRHENMIVVIIYRMKTTGRISIQVPSPDMLYYPIWGSIS